jgi:hypothetical protein
MGDGWSPDRHVTGGCLVSRSLRPWIANHQKMDTFEAFREMVSQRLSQVGQLFWGGGGRGRGKGGYTTNH